MDRYEQMARSYIDYCTEHLQEIITAHGERDSTYLFARPLAEFIKKTVAEERDACAELAFQESLAHAHAAEQQTSIGRDLVERCCEQTASHIFHRINWRS